MEPKISVVILNWNGEYLLRYHINTLINQDYKNYEIIFVDNNSDDDSINFIKKIRNDNKNIKIKIHKNDSNLGTAEGSNSAVYLCEGEYILFLSNDMDFSKNMISSLVDLANKYSDFGCGSVKFLKLENENKTNEIDSLGAEIDYMFAASSNYIGKNNDITKNISDLKVGFVFGGCLMIRKEIFLKVGMYDDEYFTLTDDIDLCMRVKLIGLNVYVTNKTELYHRVSATLSKSNRHIKRFYSERNNLRTMLKNYEIRTLIFIAPFYFLLLFSESIFFLMMFKLKLALAPLRAILWNIIKIRSTLSLRNDIQNIRTIPDKSILLNMKMVPEKLKHFVDFIFNFRKPRWKNFF